MAGGPGPRHASPRPRRRARRSSGCCAAARDARAGGDRRRPRPGARSGSSSRDEAGDRLVRGRAGRSSGWRGPSDVDGLISPGADWPVGIAARVAERLGLPHPIDAGDGGARDEQAAPARAARGGGGAAARIACSSAERRRSPVPVRREGARPAGAARPDARPLGRRAAGRDRGGGRRVARNGSALVEELVDGPEVTVNAFSVEGRFVPLTVTDRLIAEPPAFGVALAHVWPSEHDVDGRRRGGARGRGGARHPQRARRTRRCASARTGRGSSRWRRASAAATTRSSARRRSASTSTAWRSDAAVGEEPSCSLLHKRSAAAARASLPRRRPRAARSASDGVEEARGGRRRGRRPRLSRPGHVSGRSAAGRTARARCSPSATVAPTRSRASAAALVRVRWSGASYELDSLSQAVQSARSRPPARQDAH